jgi:hypothetical protein
MILTERGAAIGQPGGNLSPMLTIPRDRHLDGCSVLARVMELQQQGDKRFSSRFAKCVSPKATYRSGLPCKECGCGYCVLKTFSE